MNGISLRPAWLNKQNVNIEINFREKSESRISKTKKTNKLIEYFLLDSKKYMLNFEEFLEFINSDNFDLEKCNVNNINFNYNKINNLEDNELYWSENYDYEDFELEDYELCDYDNLENQDPCEWDIEDFEKYMYYKYLDDSESFSDGENYN